MNVGASGNGRDTHCAGVLPYVLPIPAVLLFGIRRPFIRIPAVAENGNGDPLPACRRSLSGTHFAQMRQQCATGKGRGRFAPPPGCPPGGLRALLGSLAPLAQRAIERRVVGETATADSPPYAPNPGGEHHSEDRQPRGNCTASAPRHNIMYRIA